MTISENENNILPHGILTVFLMTEKGLHFLKRTYESYGYLFSLVVIGNDKAVLNDFTDDIIEFCEERRMHYVLGADHRNITTEYAMAISWRWLIDHPVDKLIVFHDSILPRYRGFAPLVNSLVNGECEIGVTALFGSKSFDTGDIIFQAKCGVNYPIKINDAITLNNENLITVAEFVLNKLQRGLPLESSPQIDEKSSYSVWRDELDYAIDWNESAAIIKRFIDSVGYPYRGASTKLDNFTVRIIDAIEVGDVNIENRHIGKTLFIEGGKPVVICGSGLLKIIDAIMFDGQKSVDLFPLRRFRMRFV